MHLKDDVGITYQCRSFDRDANDGVSQEDFYALLGCNQEDSPEIIKRCFHKQMLIWHPDKNPTNRDYVSTRCQWIADAYKILGNLEAKEWWDRRLTRKNNCVELISRFRAWKSGNLKLEMPGPSVKANGPRARLNFALSLIHI